MTQHEKIIEMCMSGAWVCQAEFWKNYIFSPHKRRGEIEQKTDKNGNKLYQFYERPCEHGIAQSKDFLLRFLNPPKNPASNYRCKDCSKTAVTYLEDKPVCQTHSVREVAPAGLF